MRALPSTLSLLLVLAACTSASDRSPVGQAGADSAARIQHVLRGLRPAVEVVGAAPVRWTLAERMKEHRVPGVSIAVIDSGRIVWARGFGVKEAGGTDSVTASTLFQAASISKPVAVSAMLRLMEQGKLALDTNVNRYLTSWKLPENHFTAGHPVTLRLLVSHSAGTTVHGFPGYEVGKPLPTLPEVLNGTKPANTAPVRVDTVPGAIFSYSGGGLTIMQQLLIDVSGEPFPTLLRQQVLTPLGMSHSTYEQPLPDSLAASAARAHDSKGVMIPGGWHIYPEMAAAGLWTTPTDLSKWVIAITNAYAGRSTSFLSQATAKQMLTVQKAPLGLGVFLGGEGKSFHFGHGGDNEGFHAQLVMYPETGQGAAIMTNGDNGQALMQEILYSIGAEYGWPEYGPVQVNMVPVDTATLDQLVGGYAILPDSRTAAIHVKREGSHLFFDMGSSTRRQELYPESATTFVAADGGWRITFTRDQTGRATGFSFDVIPGMTVKGVRVRR